MSWIGLFTAKFQTAFRRVVLRAWRSLRTGQTWCVSPQPTSLDPLSEETLRSIASLLACPPVNCSLGRFYQRKLKVTGGCLECVASPRNHFFSTHLTLETHADSRIVIFSADRRALSGLRSLAHHPRVFVLILAAQALETRSLDRQ